MKPKHFEYDEISRVATIRPALAHRTCGLIEFGCALEKPVFAGFNQKRATK